MNDKTIMIPTLEYLKGQFRDEFYWADEPFDADASDRMLTVGPNEIMPKVYFYTDEEVGVPWPGPDSDHEAHGFPEPRFNWCEFSGFEVIADPAQADVFVVRQRLSWLDDDKIRALPYLEGNDERHVFFDLADNFHLYPLGRAMQFRACADAEMVAAQEGMIPIAWPVEDFGHLTDWNWEYDVAFQGQHNWLADKAMESCVKAGLKCNFHLTEEFWPHIRNKDPERGKELWDSFRENMRSAKLSLCPRTLDRGVVRYRLYEAMTMNRMSVLIGDACVLPFEQYMAWDYCTLRIVEAQADETGAIIGDWLTDHDDELRGRSTYARAMWANWLDRRRYGIIIAQIVRERLGC